MTIPADSFARLMALAEKHSLRVSIMARPVDIPQHGIRGGTFDLEIINDKGRRIAGGLFPWVNAAQILAVYLEALDAHFDDPAGES